MKLRENLALPDEEKKMIRLKYQSPQIKSLIDGNLGIVTKTLLLKIHVITGWTLPIGNIMIALKDLFEKKILMSYSFLNPDEIEYAFLKYGTTIEDWGKEMNLNMIDKVLIPYVEQRVEFSYNEEKGLPAPPQKVYTEEEIFNQRRGEIQSAFQAMKRGYYPIIHKYFEEVLTIDGFIQIGDNVNEFFVWALENLECIYEKQ